MSTINPNIGPYQGNSNVSRTMPNIGAWQGITIIPPPVIGTQPQDLTVYEGNLATFNIIATGTGTLTYQWFKDSLAQPGETSTTYDFTSVLGDDGAIIRCDVTDSGGTTSSNNATLTVIEVNQAITKDEYFTRTQPAKAEELVNRVEVKTQPLSPATVIEEIFSTSEKIVIAVGSSYTLTAKYGSPPALTSGAVANVTDNTGGTLTIITSTFYPWGAEILISNTDTSEGQANITIDGYPLTVQGEETIVSEDTDSIETNGLNAYAYPDNYLIQNAEIAQQISEALLSSYKTYRKDVNIVWRGNPALELGDAITVPKYQRDATIILGNFKVFKNKIDFDGTLKQTTDGRVV